MNLKYEKGTKLILALTGGEKYIGTYQSGNEYKITLTNISEYPSDTTLEYIACFYKAEIVSINIYTGLENVQKSDNNTTMVQDLCNSVNKNLIVSNIKEKVDYQEWKEMCDKYIYIDSINKDFSEAIADLKTYDLLAVHGFGCSFGELILLAISTKHQIYLFDIKLCGKDAFKNGLKFLFESANYLKIIHDLLKFGNCIKQNYDVEVIRFFDTQLRDFMIHTNSKTKVRRLKTCTNIEKNHDTFQGTGKNCEENSQINEDEEEIESLTINKKISECLYEYLNLPSNTLIDSEITPKKILERPISEGTKKKACVFVAYLIPLYYIMEDKTFEKFNKVNDMYVDSLRHENVVTAQAIEIEINSGNLPKFVEEFIKKVYS